VLVSRDRVWRADLAPSGWELTFHGGKVLSPASLDRVVAYLMDKGLYPERDLVAD
jgi:hypothetical protein